MARQDSLQLLSFSPSTMWAQLGGPESSTLGWVWRFQLPGVDKNCHQKSGLVTRCPKTTNGIQWLPRDPFLWPVGHFSGDPPGFFGAEAVASLIYCTIPLWGTFLSVIFLNEKLGLQPLGTEMGTKRQDDVGPKFMADVGWSVQYMFVLMSHPPRTVSIYGFLGFRAWNR